MQKKDLGLLVLILVVGTVVATINPRFLSPINLANTANLIGLFGLFAIGQGFVIITGGIELSVGSVIALLGVLFVDLVVGVGVPWPAAALLMLALGVLIGLAHGLLITRMGMQPFIVTLCGLLIYRGVARFYTADATAGFVFGQTFPWLEWLTVGRSLGRAALVLRHARRGGGDVGGAAPLGFRAAPLRRRQERGGGALRRRADRAGDRLGLRDLRGADRDRGDLLRHVHALDLAGLARQLLRALRHRRGGARRLQPARWRGLDRRRGARRGAAAGAAEPRQPARHPELAQLRRHGSVILVGVLADQQIAELRRRRAVRAQAEERPAAAE